MDDENRGMDTCADAGLSLYEGHISQEAYEGMHGVFNKQKVAFYLLANPFLHFEFKVFSALFSSWKITQMLSPALLIKFFLKDGGIYIFFNLTINIMISPLFI